MGLKARPKLPAEVLKVQRRIETWRRTREKRGHMSEKLWSSAVALAQIHGLYPIASGLPVSYDALKKRVVEADGGRPPAKKRRRKRKQKASFVELQPAWPGSAEPQCVVELRDPKGATMIIRTTHSASTNIAELTEAFWRRRR